jgi:oxygen-independent coproporphyrinogen-3 oxidase
MMNRITQTNPPQTRGDDAPRAPHVRPTEATLDTRFGVYVHFPYCAKKCPYCDFASFTTQPADIPHEAYRRAVVAELDLRLAARTVWPTVTSVFFGGGTPSLWAPRELGAVVSALRARLDFAPDVEITAECNPSSLDRAKASALLEVGVNRLSVGIQSLDAERLAFLGRFHDVEGGLAAVRAAREAGVERLSCDLIFAVAGGRPQAAVDAQREVIALAEFGLTHLSAYGLTIEPGTRFGELAKKSRLPIAADDVFADSFLAIDEALTARGFSHYEVSNYAMPGEEARHNLATWRGWDYLGLGSSAVGTLTDPATGVAQRTKNHPNPATYMRASTEGRLEHVEAEELDRTTRLREALMLGLRLETGIDLEELARRLDLRVLTPERERTLAKLAARGRLVQTGSRIRVPREARAFSDGIAAELF